MEERRICKRCLLGVEVPENVALYLDKFLSVSRIGSARQRKSMRNGLQYAVPAIF